MSIPPIVAIFDDTIIPRDDPLTLHRYMLVRVLFTEDAYALLPIASVGLKEVDVSETGIPEKIMGTLAVVSEGAAVRKNTTMWETGWCMEFNGSQVPVVDIEHRTLLGVLPYGLKRKGDTLAGCRMRQAAHRAMHLAIFMKCMRNSMQKRMEVGGGGGAVVAAAAPVEKSGKIPGFVGRLVKKDAIEKGETCPISTLVFEEDMEISMTPCFHLFEADAIRRWMKIKRECPVCRVAISELVDV